MEKKKILVVEDDKNMREALVLALTESGFDVFEAADGEEAVSLLFEKKDLSLVILDIILPKKNGFEVLQFLKEESPNQDVPVLLCTNLGEPSNVQKALSLGAVNYIVKSDYSLDAIVKKIKDIIEGKKVI